MDALLKKEIGVNPTPPHEKLNKMTDELVDGAISIQEKLDSLTPKVSVSVDGYNFGVIQECYHDMTIAEFVSAHQNRIATERLVQYLKKQYDGFNGVPFVNLVEETQLSETQIVNYLSMEMGLTPRQITVNRQTMFISFELVAEMISWGDEDV